MYTSEQKDLNQRVNISDLAMNMVAVFDKRLAARMIRHGGKCINANALINDKHAFIFESEPIILW